MIQIFKSVALKLVTFDRAMHSSDEEILFSKAEAKRFVVDCMEKLQSPPQHAQMMADIMVTADYCGYTSHGLNRLGNHDTTFFWIL